MLGYRGVPFAGQGVKGREDWRGGQAREVFRLCFACSWVILTRDGGFGRFS